MTLSKACISRCTFRAAALALLTAALAAPPAWAEEIAVGPGKKSLQQAFAEAKAGATIVLPEGTTTGPVALPPGVSLAAPATTAPPWTWAAAPSASR